LNKVVLFVVLLFKGRP